MSIDQEKMIVEALPSLYPLKNFEEEAIHAVLDAIPKWSPVTERLPENDEDVLVQMDDDSMMVDFRSASSNGWFWAEIGDEPLAWMPLPEPYKGVTE